MDVVTVFSLKGGTGKTTIASTLCVTGLSDGQTVVALDLDLSARHLSAFIILRVAQGLAAPQMIASPEASAVKDEAAWMRRTIQDLREQGIDRLVIDTTAAHRRWMAAACGVAQVLVTPVQPSPIEIESLVGEVPGASRTQAFVRRVSERRVRQPAWMVAPNRTTHLPTRLGRRVSEHLADEAASGAFAMAQGLRDRVAYREMFETGRTPMDLLGDNRGLSMSQLAARSEIRLLASQLAAVVPAAA